MATLHTTSGRWRLGLGLALATVGFWATLPLALKISLQQIDAWTLTWLRFLVAALIVGSWILASGRWRGFVGLGKGSWLLLAIASAGLIGNYLAYLLGLARITPGNAQILIQSAPLLLAVGGVVIFKEQLLRAQLGGFVVIVIGLLVFFAEQRGRAGDVHSYGIGALLIALGALLWAIYALAQKQLLGQFKPQQVMGFIYVVASIVLLPTATPGALAQVDAWHWLAIAYCSLNTLGAYGCFAEALNHWEASRVSAILALTPISTLAFGAALALAFPGQVPEEQIGWLGAIGALLVVGGSITASLAARRRKT